MKHYTVNGKTIDSLEDLPEGTSSVVVTTVRTEDDISSESIVSTTLVLDRKSLLSCTRALLSTNRKIAAIKLVCAYTGWEKRETKEFVESLAIPVQKTYPCELYLNGEWKYVGQKTLDAAIKTFETDNVSISLDTGDDTWVSLHTFLYGNYLVTNDDDELTEDGITKTEAIAVFRNQF